MTSTLPTIDPVRYPEIVGRHAPTVDSLLVGQRAVGRKVWATSKLLALQGKPWKARSLRNGFKAFCVQNTLGCAAWRVADAQHGV